MFIFPTHYLLKGLLLISNVIFNKANATSFHGKLPDLALISTLFDTFIKPYLNTRHSEPSPRAFDDYERAIERVVRQKIKQLQPFLQDDDIDESEDKITLEGNDETIIMEFVPQIGEKSKAGLRNGNDTFKANMRRYKKVRSKIYEALDAEMVSDNTKNLVMQTLDELLSKMVETQCHWKGGIEDIADNINDRFIVPRTIIDMWKSEWQKFKTKFLTSSRLKARKQFDDNFGIMMSYLTKLNSIINDISVNLESFTKKYKISCNVSERNFNKNNTQNQKPDSYRFSYDSEEKNMCKSFKVCSKELKTFFIDFYKSINDTAVNVLKSYAEMFARDVNTDVSNEKNSVVDLIFKMADQAEKDIIKIFVNYTTHFHLDPRKDKEANLNFLIRYVKKVIKRAKEEVNKNLFIKLNHLHKKVSSTIQKDIEMNLGVDLGNLQRDLTSKICLMFNICNGNTKTRRHGNTEERENLIDNENKVYVKVELTIDEDQSNLLGDNASISDVNIKKVSEVITRFRNFQETTLNYANISEIYYEKYANISVTRTTLKTAL